MSRKKVDHNNLFVFVFFYQGTGQPLIHGVLRRIVEGWRLEQDKGYTWQTVAASLLAFSVACGIEDVSHRGVKSRVGR